MCAWCSFLVVVFFYCLYFCAICVFFQPKRVLLCAIKMYATLDARHPVWEWDTIKMIPLERENMCYFLLQPFVKVKTSLCKTALWNKAQVSWSRSSFTQALLLVPPGKISWCTIFLRVRLAREGLPQENVLFIQAVIWGGLFCFMSNVSCGHRRVRVFAWYFGVTVYSSSSL